MENKLRVLALKLEQNIKEINLIVIELKSLIGDKTYEEPSQEEKFYNG